MQAFPARGCKNLIVCMIDDSLKKSNHVPMTDNDSPKSPKMLEREREAKRKAQALRDNLRRRKQAGRASKTSD